MKRRESLLLLIFSLGFALPVAQPPVAEAGLHPHAGATFASLDFLTSEHALREAELLQRRLRTYHPGYGREFNGYGFGAGQFVCTTFAAEALWRAGWSISKSTWDHIQINTIEPGNRLDVLLAQGDPRMKGIVHALTTAGGGYEVGLSDLQPGDWIQYWYRSSGRPSVKGHVALIKQVTRSGQALEVRLLGANESTRGVAEFDLRLLDPKGRGKMLAVFAVRPLQAHPRLDPRTRLWDAYEYALTLGWTGLRAPSPTAIPVRGAGPLRPEFGF